MAIYINGKLQESYDSTEVFYNNGTVSSGTAVIDYSKGTYHKLTVGGNITISFINLPPAGVAWSIVLKLVNGLSYTITWPGVMTTQQNMRLEQTVTGVDLLLFNGHNSSTSFDGSLMGFNYS